jgi:hypothetical protein
MGSSIGSDPKPGVDGTIAEYGSTETVKPAGVVYREMLQVACREIGGAATETGWP